jgi:hypothetical protein
MRIGPVALHGSGVAPASCRLSRGRLALGAAGGGRPPDSRRDGATFAACLLCYNEMLFGGCDSYLSCAEVVELADTASTRIALAILYKLLIINLLPFASITSGNVPRNGQ